eukprot:evm.model.scf_185.8 EVM.evm.TU.scf_185.8   scf_185:85464-87473(+)
MKTADNLAVVARIPADRFMVETDCPYCDIRSTHASKPLVRTAFEAKDKKKHSGSCMVKGRNEPCTVRQVMEVVAGVMGQDEVLLSETVWQNTTDMFFAPSAK